MIDDFSRAKKPKTSSARKPKLEISEETFDEPVQAPFIDPRDEVAPEATAPEEATEDQVLDEQSEPEEPQKQLPAHAQKRFHIWPRRWSTKKKRVMTGLLVLVVLGLSAGGYYLYAQRHKPTKKVVSTQTKAVVVAPTTVASPLTGVQVAPALAKRATVGVMIENSPDARPQSGLMEAGVVYEAVAEGGITRFLALFQETNPASVGPIRSSRPYYLDWLLPFDASYAHVGGSPEALQQIKDLHVKDLDQFVNGSSYDRITTRYAPHNVYTSIDRLYSLAQSKGYTTSTFTGFARKTKESPVATPTAKTVDFTISGPLFNAHYDYDATTNSYLRSEGGKPHMDLTSGKQLAPKVVIGLVVPSTLEADGTHSSYATTGSGTMYVFQDGTVTQGTWKKDSRTAQFTFTDSTGQTLKLNPGQTWISVVNATTDVAYKP